MQNAVPLGTRCLIQKRHFDSQVGSLVAVTSELIEACSACAEEG